MDDSDPGLQLFHQLRWLSMEHVRRVRDSRDRRRVFLQVTPEAIELGWAFFGPQISGMVRAMRSFSDTELAATARFLRAMTAVAAAGRAAPSPAQ